jgi:hypothetical protein
MDKNISIVSDHCKEQIAFLSPKHKLEAIEDLTTNIQVLRTLINSTTQIKADVLDEGEVARIVTMRNETTNLVYLLNEKLDLLRASLNLSNR